ncbi:glutathione S-transferase domain-containing protein [Phlyctema vagabunda]|uniref:Glutathione S-transferase domain-containing protein n=1 Tax=Phlyctema vagabunda TaxID=108571 RepID=A0ABR4PPL9_9HELO
MSANRGAKITLSWLEHSRAQRIVWLLEELNLSYDLKAYERDNQRAPPELRQIHPLGKSPIVTILYPDTVSPRVVAESAAVVEHLVENFEGHNLVPKRFEGNSENKFGRETEEWARYRYYMHYAEGSLMPLLVTQILMNAIKSAPVPFFIKPATKLIAGKVSNEYLEGNYKTTFNFLESQLATSPGGGEFLCGKNLSAADILMSFPILVAFEVAISKEQYPRLAAYAGRLQAIEGYKKAIKKVEDMEGVPYKLL